jgi:enoyl-CoA hydratase/carnithine racemase
MLGEMRSAINQAAHDPAVFGIVITGAGRGFCSGLDAAALGETTAAGSSGRPKPTDDIPGMFTWLLKIDKPVIAAVNGVAAGGGFVLTVMSDIRIVSTDAAFITIFSKRGLIAEHGTTWIVPRLVGVGRALDLLWTSRKVTGAEAVDMGLAEYLTEPDQLLARARQYIVDMAESVSPASVADTKRLVYRQMGLGYEDALRETDSAQWIALDRIDAKEGATALLEKRAPNFPRLGR